MATRAIVTIDGQRHDITGVPVITEHACDRCGRYTVAYTRVALPVWPGQDLETPVGIELCAECVLQAFPGLLDIARKVAGRA